MKHADNTRLGVIEGMLHTSTVAPVIGRINTQCIAVLTTQGHAHDMGPCPAQMVHQRPHISRHDASLVCRKLLWDAAAADAPVVKGAASADAWHAC